MADVAGCVTTTKPRLQSLVDRRACSDKLPDLSIHLHDVTLVTDVAFVCTTAPTYVGKWWRDAVEQREKHKTDKYRDLLVAQAARDGSAYSFLPFVMTVHGDTGLQADHHGYDGSRGGTQRPVCG